MKRNKNGFTLIELLGVIVILSILVAITTPFVLDALNSGKNGSYDIMVDNIVTASKMFYEECSYDNVYDSEGNLMTCKISDEESITISLIDLVDAGFLTGSGVGIKNPKTDTDISNCQIKITVSKDIKGKISYVVKSLTSTGDCPTNDVDTGNLGVTN